MCALALIVVARVAVTVANFNVGDRLAASGTGYLIGRKRVVKADDLTAGGALKLKVLALLAVVILVIVKVVVILVVLVVKVKLFLNSAKILIKLLYVLVKLLVVSL